VRRDDNKIRSRDHAIVCLHLEIISMSLVLDHQPPDIVSCTRNTRSITVGSTFNGQISQFIGCYCEFTRNMQHKTRFLAWIQPSPHPAIGFLAVALCWGAGTAGPRPWGPLPACRRFARLNKTHSLGTSPAIYNLYFLASLFIAAL